MEWQSFQILLCLVFYILINPACGISITMEPPGPVKPGTDVRIICNISKTYQDSPVTWLRKTASIEFQIAKAQALESTLYKSGRYLLDTGGTNTGVLHILELKPAQYEDIGEIGCDLDQSTKEEPVYINLIVCSNPDSDWCKCIIKKKWADPTCAKESSSAAATNKSLKQGLGICLGIALVYGFIMTILAGVDCSSRLHKRRLKAQQKAVAKEARRRNPYGESEELTLDISDPENVMNSSQVPQDMRVPSEPMRYPELSAQENGQPPQPIKADIHNGGNYRREDPPDRYEPPDYPEEVLPRKNYPRNQYKDAVNALSNNYSDYGSKPGDYGTKSGDHYDYGPGTMEPLNTISQGYDRANLPRSTDYNTPGKLSTHSMDYNPQHNYINNADRQAYDYPNKRGAYSEQKPRVNGRGVLPNNAEPRRLDFSRTIAAEVEPSGPYISPDTSV